MTIVPPGSPSRRSPRKSTTGKHADGPRRQYCNKCDKTIARHYRVDCPVYSAASRRQRDKASKGVGPPSLSHTTPNIPRASDDTSQILQAAPAGQQNLSPETPATTTREESQQSSPNHTTAITTSTVTSTVVALPDLPPANIGQHAANPVTIINTNSLSSPDFFGIRSMDTQTNVNNSSRMPMDFRLAGLFAAPSGYGPHTPVSSVHSSLSRGTMPNLSPPGGHESPTRFAGLTQAEELQLVDVRHEDVFGPILHPGAIPSALPGNEFPSTPSLRDVHSRAHSIEPKKNSSVPRWRPSLSNAKYGFVDGVKRGSDEWKVARKTEQKTILPTTSDCHKRFGDNMQAIVRLVGDTSITPLPKKAEEMSDETGAWVYVAAQMPTARHEYVHYESKRLRREARPQVNELNAHAHRMFRALVNSRRKNVLEAELESARTREHAEAVARENEQHKAQLEELRKLIISKAGNTSDTSFVDQLRQVVALPSPSSSSST
ncbi:hypothetical protein VNI00_018857 [Paramarasmius palmivorus]|uniref:Uncharacterized protein n=1 Tax=Paramarasmius palmivorus TaxID=297713 RepID=A0AAW0ATK1_9AGAR